MSGTTDPLIKNPQTLVAFARKRVGDPQLAEDLVQESLLKAVKSARKPTNDEELTVWFYRILRRSIIDLYRRKGARERALENFKEALPEQPDPSSERVLCQYFKRLLPDLPDQYRDLLQKVDLEGVSPKETASILGVTANNLTVRLHRARQNFDCSLSAIAGHARSTDASIAHASIQVQLPRRFSQAIAWLLFQASRPRSQARSLLPPFRATVSLTALIPLRSKDLH